MKVAYMFHGHSRTWKECFQSFFDNVYSVAPGDIFIHTWDRVNSKYGSFWNKNLGILNNEHEEISCQTLDLDAIRKTYNPKHITVETDLGIELPFRECPQLSNVNLAPSHLGAYNMIKSQYNSYKLAESAGEYDIYFSLRMDLFFTNKLNESDLYESNYMVVPPTFTDYDDPRTEMIFDIFAFANKNIMKTRAEFYHHVWDYWYSKNNVYQYFLEHAATRYFRDNNIKAKPGSLNFEVKRLF